MVDNNENKGFDIREQLIQELLFHARNSSNRALEFSASATANIHAGDKIAARNCQYLADLNAHDALLEAYEAGEVASTNEERKNEEDPVFVGFTGLAMSSMGLAMIRISEAQTFSEYGADSKKVLEEATNYRQQALDQAYEAGKYIGDGKRSGIRPTFTILPEEK